MAKAYHLKEIIKLETGNSYLKSIGCYIRNKVAAKTSRISFHGNALNEMAIWKAALQLDIPMMNQRGLVQ
jgi:hypothetical protein